MLNEISFLFQKPDTFVSIFLEELKNDKNFSQEIYSLLYSFYKDYDVKFDFYEEFLENLALEEIKRRETLIFILNFLLNDKLSVILVMRYVKKILSFIQQVDTQNVLDILIIIKKLFYENIVLYKMFYENEAFSYNGEKLYISELKIF